MVTRTICYLTDANKLLSANCINVTTSIHRHTRSHGTNIYSSTNHSTTCTYEQQHQ